MLNNEPTGTGTGGDASASASNRGPDEQAPDGATRRGRRRPAKAAGASNAAPSGAGVPDAADDRSVAAVRSPEEAEAPRTRRRRKPAERDESGILDEVGTSPSEAPVAARKRTAKKAVAAAEEPPAEEPRARRSRAKKAPATASSAGPEAPEPEPARKRRARAAKQVEPSAGPAVSEPPGAEPVGRKASGRKRAGATRAAAEPAAAPAAAGPEPTAARPSSRGAPPPPTVVVFKAAEIPPAPAQAAAAETTLEPELAEDGEPARARRGRQSRRGADAEAEPSASSRRSRRAVEDVEPEPVSGAAEEQGEDDDDEARENRRRRRGRRGRGRGKGTFDAADDEAEQTEAEESDEPTGAADGEEPLTRRRRRRRRSGAAGESDTSSDDGVVTVVKIREPRGGRDQVQGVSGSTRLEAKRQRRRDGREQRRTRPPILTESEFLARREAVDRVMVVRQKGDRTQIAVLEDGTLVEHYVTRHSASTMVGNVYLGRVQNVLPSMEAAFVDIGRGRNAVLYAGEVNWDASGLEGRARSIEQALKSGESVPVQVTKDPVGHKGARLTSHVALSGRHLVYVPNGHASGISRKLSDVERRRLRDVLKNLVPDGAGVIVRTAAEGAAEEDLSRDVKRLQAQWEDIQAKAAAGSAPALLYSEPDLVIRVVRDLFNEDFRELVIQGSDAYEQVEAYLAHVSPDLVTRIRRHTGPADGFAELRIDEQILKGLDRKVYLPSGGHLVIDRTEAMTVVDVNTGKYTGAGGNLEETVTRNNLEAAEEIVRQLRLRDLGGIIVIDFIDMVLESNRELVLRRLTECLGRDRTKHQVTEITSLGLVQMTRKRIGQGLLEAFSETCEHCKGRGVIVQTEPVVEKPRTNVAEKVRAVAASVRAEAAEVAGAGDDAAAVEGQELDAEVAEVSGSDIPEEPAAVVEDIYTDDRLGGEIEGGQAEDGPGSVRRRSRRGGSRRRARA